MKIYGLVCTKDEADRYLNYSLFWNQSFLDDLFVYDDQSTDESVKIATNLGLPVEVRPDNVPTFMTNESDFRQAAWDAMADRFLPTEDDWILVMDADELWVSAEEERKTLESLTNEDANVEFKVFEVFGYEDAVPMQRVDGFWGEIVATRFTRFQPNGKFAAKGMGGGSIPNYFRPKRYVSANLAGIVHYGYAEERDRAAKFDRYSAKRVGHSLNHLNSILQEPSLEEVPSWAT